MQLLVETGYYERHSRITDGHAESFWCEESSKKVEGIDMKETLFLSSWRSSSSWQSKSLTISLKHQQKGRTCTGAWRCKRHFCEVDEVLEFEVFRCWYDGGLFLPFSSSWTCSSAWNTGNIVTLSTLMLCKTCVWVSFLQNPSFSSTYFSVNGVSLLCLEVKTSSRICEERKDLWLKIPCFLYDSRVYFLLLLNPCKKSVSLSQSRKLDFMLNEETGSKGKKKAYHLQCLVSLSHVSSVCTTTWERHDATWVPFHLLLHLMSYMESKKVAAKR